MVPAAREIAKHRSVAGGTVPDIVQGKVQPERGWLYLQWHPPDPRAGELCYLRRGEGGMPVGELRNNGIGGFVQRAAANADVRRVHCSLGAAVVSVRLGDIGSIDIYAPLVADRSVRVPHHRDMMPGVI